MENRQWCSSWERWRPAGEFRFSAPDWPAGRRRSQEDHGSGLVYFLRAQDGKLIKLNP
jgi:hypothetical protein